MAERKRIALVYTYSENWIGGTYYIENLVAALSQLPDALQPQLVIVSQEKADAVRLQQAVTYPYWSFRLFERPLSLPERAINKLTFKLLGKRLISAAYNDSDLVFPFPTMWRQYFSHIQHHLYWIPDFQEHYLPAFFQPTELEVRKADQQSILQLARHIVFSSHAAQHDFNSIYPHNNLMQYVLQFAVTSRTTHFAADICLQQYGIDRPYFICSNQFWKHKNHPIVLRAIDKLRQTHPQALVVFTGKEHDYRNPAYFDELMDLCNALDVGDNVKFLGFIARDHQLTLMQSALAVLQPSLFEGWSTVVEDAKSLNVPLVVSDIAVHREQLAHYNAKLFFPAGDDDALVDCLEVVLLGELPAQPYNYKHDVMRFAQAFMSIVSQVVAE